MLFETLYEKDKNNKVKEWKIKVEDKKEYSEISYTYGFVDGKKIEYSYKIEKGKNIGKKNETTHYQQAIADAKSKWENKKKNGYNTDINNDKQIQLPMLANEYNKCKNKIKFEAYIQPKLDGYRMLYNPNTKKMTTRSGKEFTILEGTKLEKELEILCKDNKETLDGELYVHDKIFNFENYGILRKEKKEKLTENDNKKLDLIEYHIYDIISNDNFIERNKRLTEYLYNKYDKIKLVETRIVKSESDILNIHKEYIENGYEGSMIRNKNGGYKCKYRSNDLLKYKNFDDDEFEIIDYTSEILNDGLIVWVCKTKENKKFNVQSKGTREERQELYKNAKELIGKKLWVQYFGLTNDNIPRFPKTMRNGREAIRDIKL